jgi:hypothetical protein
VTVVFPEPDPPAIPINIAFVVCGPGFISANNLLIEVTEEIIT